jgi:hypothetical protein
MARNSLLGAKMAQNWRTLAMGGQFGKEESANIQAIWLN